MKNFYYFYINTNIENVNILGQFLHKYLYKFKPALYRVNTMFLAKPIIFISV